MKYLEMKKKAILSVIGKVKGFVRSVTGVPPIALEACADNMSIINYKIHGNSIQDGTPSPDNPIEVQSVGELVADETDINYGKYKIPVTARSKNYCNPIFVGLSNQNAKYSIDNKGIVSWKRTNVNYSGGVILKTFLKAGTYDFTTKLFNVSGYSPINSYILYLRNNLKFTNGSSASYGKSTLVVSEDSYVSFIVYPREADSERVIGNSCSWSIMVTDSGVSGEDYEPYHEPITTNIYLDEPLRKVGDYADYIDFKNGMVVRNIENKVFNGSENWSESGYNPQITINYMQFWIDYIRNKTLCSSVLSNILESTNSNNWSNLNLEKEFILISTSRDIGIRLSKNRVSNLEEFKSLLSNNNMSVYFVSNTPTQTPISLPILPTFKGITTIYEVGTTIQPSNMEAEYYSTLKGE